MSAAEAPRQFPEHTAAAPQRTMLIDQRFAAVAGRFFGMFPLDHVGGGALAVYLHGMPVLDIWAGHAAPGRRWQADTLALSYSTGKGVAATVLHRLAERGLIGYDTPVAEYWPEFAARGKADITVREVLAHRSGLQNVRDLPLTPAEMLDHDALAAALANTAPDPRRHRAPGYHALTFGTLVAEICQRATGLGFRELTRSELAAVLGEEDYWFGTPAHVRSRIATLGPRFGVARIPVDRLQSVARRVSPTLPLGNLLPDGLLDLGRDPSTPAHDAMLPGGNGVFTARSVAKMYAAIANDGMVGQRRLLRPETVRTIAQMPHNAPYDYAIGLPFQHSMGYHRMVVGTKLTREALGHYGLGGSGGLAIPRAGLSLAFLTSKLGGRLTTFGDPRIALLTTATTRAAALTR